MPPLPPPWRHAAQALYEGRERSAAALAALRPFQRSPRALVNARVLDIACPRRSHRIAEVIRTAAGPVFIAKGVKYQDFDEVDLDSDWRDFEVADPYADLRDSGLVVTDATLQDRLVTKTTSVVNVVDLLTLPTMFAPEAPDALPGQCACRGWFLSATALLELMESGRGPRVLAEGRVVLAE